MLPRYFSSVILNLLTSVESWNEFPTWSLRESRTTDTAYQPPAAYGCSGTKDANIDPAHRRRPGTGAAPGPTTRKPDVKAGVSTGSLMIRWRVSSGETPVTLSRGTLRRSTGGSVSGVRPAAKRPNLPDESARLPLASANGPSRNLYETPGTCSDVVAIYSRKLVSVGAKSETVSPGPPAVSVMDARCPPAEGETASLKRTTTDVRSLARTAEINGRSVSSAVSRKSTPETPLRLPVTTISAADIPYPSVCTL